MGGATMTAMRGVLATLLVMALQSCLAESQQQQAPAMSNLKFAKGLPKHLAEHYDKKGPDNVVYFSFCIA